MLQDALPFYTYLIAEHLQHDFINYWIKLYTGLITAFELMLAFLQFSLSPFNFSFYSILPTLPTIVKSILESVQSYVTILNDVKRHINACFFPNIF